MLVRRRKLIIEGQDRPGFRGREGADGTGGREALQVRVCAPLIPLLCFEPHYLTGWPSSTDWLGAAHTPHWHSLITIPQTGEPGWPPGSLQCCFEPNCRASELMCYRYLSQQGNVDNAALRSQRDSKTV